MSNFEKRIVLSAGGTGGHMFPAQALAHQLSSQGYKLFIFSDDRGHDFKDSSFSMIRIPVGQLHGSIGKKLHGGFNLMKGMGTALYHLQSIQPHAVIGFGGYASFPTMLAAALRRFPTIIHQADAYFGRTNCLLSPFVTRIATSFPHVENIPSSYKSKVSFTGLPIRSEIQPTPYIPSMENDPFHLLVTGGSQGAKIFGDMIPRAIQLLDTSLQRRLHITQQCRSESLELTHSLYKHTKATVELSPFLDQMGERYKKAHLVISRSGASSVIEAALVGRPALFIPYPYAMDNHQFYNAQEVVNVQGGWVMQEKELTSQCLATFLSELMTSHWKLKKAAVNIQTIVIPDASVRLANLVKVLTERYDYES
jgi:UDP-N-acetylglucosamine--N-acetylmuramyl-(pentapeptide) pyrophosphoryl-undecaprenol N-acetylglucosamine transferase